MSYAVMSYDFDYYSGLDIRYPNKPTKPRLDKNAAPAAVRSYADELEQYERDIEKYRAELEHYNTSKHQRDALFRARLRDDYDITEAQFDVLWHQAWEHGHAAGLREVYNYFDDFYEMAAAFAALEKTTGERG